MIRIIFIFFMSFHIALDSQDLLNYQLGFSRVLEAKNSKYNAIQKIFSDKNLNFPNTRIYFRALKWNKKLELWAYSYDSSKYILVKNYDICATVGDLGPKRKEGDLQIPEGIYEIKTLNPSSKYYLSMEISYPNESDLILGNRLKPGGDIYVHGSCETIGCLPITDDIIKEIYLITLYAKSFGQESIPIHIYPTKLTLNNYNKLKGDYFKNDVRLLEFWKNLKEIWDYFEKYRNLPDIYIDTNNGKYLIAK